MLSDRKIKSALESLMFVWGEPLDVKVAAEALNQDWKHIYNLCLELQEEYRQENRGIRIRRTDRSFQFITFEENYDYIEKMCRPVKKRKLSQSAMEVLAIIAYKQPVTRGEVESVRGIKCERVIEGLLNRNLIKETGRSNSIGRPILYGTTEEFLKYMNIEDLSMLPELEDVDSQTDEFENH